MTGMKKLLIVYYSWSNGNTERIAKALQMATGADITRIETVTPYLGGYANVVAQAQDEVQRSYMPPIQPLGVDVADYDIVAVGTPTWWYTMAPAVLTFLKGQDWTGKTVIPFMTNGGWPRHVIKDMKTVCHGAKTVCEFEARFDSSGGDQMVTPETEITAWAEAVKKVLEN